MMPEKDLLGLDEPPSPIPCIGLTHCISTPTTSIGFSPLHTGQSHYGGAPHNLAQQTPNKCVGQLFGHQYTTPSAGTQGWNTLQSSPCYRTPGSTSCRTPGSASSGSIGTRMSRKLRTPSSNQSCKKLSTLHQTPDQGTQPYNPFDGNLLEKLDGSVFSPNVFTEVRSVTQTPKTFQWTIDELALVKPVDIEENPDQPDAVGASGDSDLEKRAQDAIEAYFARNLIAPSPWSEGANKKPFILPQTPRTPVSPSHMMQMESPMTFADRKTPVVEKKLPVCDASCQTTLTLPVDFDMAKVLGEYLTFTKHRDSEDGSSQERLSISSLRRKLFFHGEDGAPPSPVKANRDTDAMDFDSSPVVSPVKYIHRTPKQKYSPLEKQTPGSDQFSSSPISTPRSNDALTPFMRRCSTAPDLLDSPGFSPICGNVHSSQSMTPLCHPLQATPGSGHSSGRGSRPFDSPGMSPITQHEHDGSFVATPAGLTSSSGRRGADKLPVVRVLQSLPDTDQVEEDGSFQKMDVESGELREEEELSFLSSQEDRYNQLRSRSTDDTRYFSDDDLSNQEACQTYFVSQSHDTGYNTNSLQLTNTQDPVLHSGIGTQIESSLHTNLTQQFGSLPFSTSVDMESSSSETSKRTRKPVVRHLALKSRVRNEMSESPADDSVLNYRDVRRRAKQILGKSMSMDDSQLGASLDSASLRPGLLSSIGVCGSSILPGRSPGGTSQHEVLTDNTVSNKVLPSEHASRVLQKAGEDFRRYCYSPDSPPTQHVDNLQQLDNDQYYFVNIDEENFDNPQGLRVSMSAEF